MSTAADIAEPSTKTEAPSTPFKAALEKAGFSQKQASEAEPPAKEAEATKAKAEPAPKAEARKDGTPRELFKKPEATPDASKTAERDGFDEIAEPDIKDDKGRKGWDALKGEGRKWKAEATTAAAKLKEQETQLAELNTLREQLAEREKTIAEQSSYVAKARLQDHPDFKREFEEGDAALVRRAQRIVEESGGDAKAVERALTTLAGKSQVEALREISESMDHLQAGRLGRVLDEIGDLRDRRAAKLEKAREEYAAIQQEEKKRAAEGYQRTQQERRAQFDETVTRLRGDLEVLKHAEGHDEWNARSERIVKEARDFVDQNPGADIEAEILARSIPAYRDLFLQADTRAETLEKENADLKRELKEFHSKSPRLSASEAGAKTDSKKPFSEKLEKMFGGGDNA